MLCLLWFNWCLSTHTHTQRLMGINYPNWIKDGSKLPLLKIWFFDCRISCVWTAVNILLLTIYCQAGKDIAEGQFNIMLVRQWNICINLHNWNLVCAALYETYHDDYYYFNNIMLASHTKSLQPETIIIFLTVTKLGCWLSMVLCVGQRRRMRFPVQFTIHCHNFKRL